MEEIKKLWFESCAWRLKRPSIDRIDNDGDYTYDNCRFIELGKNSAERNTRVSSKSVLQYDLDGNFIREFVSYTQVAFYLNCSITHVHRILKDNKIYKNFIWKYKNEL